MKLYAIGDLHLSFQESIIPGQWENVEQYKPMNIFGQKWEEHYRNIYINWTSLVTEDDIVLLPGDISWASNLEELAPDLTYLTSLPGKKVFIRGNHDYWWQGIKKLRAIFPADCYLIQNDSFCFGDIVIAGSRGWTAPNDYQYSEKDEKIYNRELIRLELSLQTMPAAVTKIAMLHYMPVNEKHQYNKLIELLQDYDVDICIYGHLHGEEAHQNRLCGNKWGIDFRLVSADFVNFIPQLILAEQA